MPVVCKSHWLWTINWVLACAPPPCLNIPAGRRPPYHPTTAGRPMSLYMDHGPAPHVLCFVTVGLLRVSSVCRLDIHKHTPCLYKSRSVWFSWGLLISITAQPSHIWYQCTAHVFFCINVSVKYFLHLFDIFISIFWPSNIHLQDCDAG